jgi:hypothetical protein
MSNLPHPTLGPPRLRVLWNDTPRQTVCVAPEYEHTNKLHSKARKNGGLNRRTNGPI